MDLWFLNSYLLHLTPTSFSLPSESASRKPKHQFKEKKKFFFSIKGIHWMGKAKFCFLIRGEKMLNVMNLPHSVLPILWYKDLRCSLLKNLQLLPLLFSSVAQLHLTFWDPTDCSMPGLPVHRQLPELTQTHVHWVSDAILPSNQHPLSSPSPSALNLSQHQDLFKWVSSSHQVAKLLEFQLQHQSFQWIFRTDFL